MLFSYIFILLAISAIQFFLACRLLTGVMERIIEEKCAVYKNSNERYEKMLADSIMRLNKAAERRAFAETITLNDSGNAEGSENEERRN